MSIHHVHSTLRDNDFVDAILWIWLKSKKYSWVTMVAYASSVECWKLLMSLAVLSWFLINWLLIKSVHLRSSQQEVFYKNDVPENFTKFIEKNLRRSLFFNKVAGLQLSTLLKTETSVQVFSCEFLKIPISQSTCKRLLMHLIIVATISKLSITKNCGRVPGFTWECLLKVKNKGN